MASETKRTPVVLTDAYVDICAIAGMADTANVAVVIQVSTGYSQAELIFGGGSAPSASVPGIRLADKAAMRGTAANIWARGNGSLIVHKE